MTRAVDVLSILLLLSAAVCFSLGIYSLGSRQDLEALYWLVVGALLLKAATDMLRPRGRR